MSVARLVADQRTLYRVPVAFTCALLGLSVAWFYKWRNREPTKTQLRRAKVDDLLMGSQGWQRERVADEYFATL